MNKRPLLALGMLSLALSSQAAFINGSFEEPFQNSAGQFTTGAPIPGWSTTTAGGVWRLPASGFFNTTAPDGQQIGYLNGTFLSQQLADTIAEGDNILSFYAGRRSDNFAGSFDVEVFAGGSIVNNVVVGGTLLSTYVFDHTQVAPTSFTLVELTYTALAGDANIGQQVSVQITKTAGSQANFDDFRFQGGAVPEPATLGLLALALPALLKRRAKK